MNNGRTERYDNIEWFDEIEKRVNNQIATYNQIQSWNKPLPPRPPKKSWWQKLMG